MNEARQILRHKYVAADVGITGANFLIAETGSTVIVTNEGNGDLSQSLPRTQKAGGAIRDNGATFTQVALNSLLHCIVAKEMPK